MLYTYICMLHGIPYTSQSLFCIQYIISGHLNSAAQNDRAACTVSSWGETIQIGSWRRTPRHMLWLEIVEDQFTVTQW